MDVAENLKKRANRLETITMHTAGEPTRIIVRGYPQLNGDTLLQKRRDAMENHDHIRKLLMSEPRGHKDMYGAILVQETELTERGEADIGVLFCHNEGYSTMCGHATIALGRFLIDTHDEVLFPRCKEVRNRNEGNKIRLNLHAPCGLVKIAVPRRIAETPETVQADCRKPVSFHSVPSFSVCVDLVLELTRTRLWPEIIEAKGERPKVKLDIAYGGAFYAIVQAEELGFRGVEGRVSYDNATIRALDFATSQVKNHLQEMIQDLLAPVAHIVKKDLLFLYGVTVIDRARLLGSDSHADDQRRDRNLCFFADQQLDRSPTGSCVSARVALDVTKGKLDLGDSWTFHSIVSEMATEADVEAFIGSAVECKRLNGEGGKFVDAYIVQVEGRAWYVGAETFVLEPEDSIGKGFLIDEL